ncbi:LysM peptidoglycan-binding domain-containing protein [Micromonospora sp. WMMD1082]|uniref:LysM peptidoglycan-binding domain-containing protein n=1 Tax=Micromonospora sp. WMMD1082 TaxID=3016104 RepID=UPI002417DBC1|nr:LysM peptidoglycan-binding domain-containing protein [Micromonospora sp. WMMD1082]MDG4794929.1 LysM peptidoglycan-binding domain-containing protein [Micromonospora sp. WMMD1082]
MAASGGTAVRRVGHLLTGFGALVALVGLLVGGPIALLAFAGNPLPDHLPTLAEVGATLTSRDDGQLFLRALAIAGWFGWATFALSVLVELGAQALDRPAPRLPGLGRQQRAAAALVGSVALILAASPAATAATTAHTAPAYATGPAATAALAPATAPAMSAHAATGPATATTMSVPTARSVSAATGPATAAGPAAAARADRDGAADTPVYRVARGDYLGGVADRYLDDFDDYRRLAALNELRDPDLIRPGQLIKLPAEARDQGSRSHATGRLVAPKARPTPGPATPDRAERERPTPPTPGGAVDQPGSRVDQPGSAVEQPGGTVEQPGGAVQQPGGAAGQPGGTVEQPGVATPAPTGTTPEGAQPPARGDTSAEHSPVVTVGAARAGEPDRVNRPLAVSAVLAVASIVGAQIGAVLGLRRRPAVARAGRPALDRAAARRPPASPPRELPVGRHRKD